MSAVTGSGTAMSSKRPSSLQEEIALRGAVWALVGVIFGLLFVMLVEALRDHLASPGAFAVATVGAAALTALFYGSMRLTVLVANFTFIAMLAYVWQVGAPLVLEPLVFIGAGTGLAVGALYGLKDKASRVYCAEAKIIAGAAAGVLGAALAVLPGLLIAEPPVTLIAMLVVPVTVLLYIRLSGWFIARCHRLLPAFIDGAVVGFGVGGVTGMVFLIFAGTLDPQLLGSERLLGFVQRVEGGWVPTLLGCAAVCFAVGALRAVLRRPWYDR